MKLIKTIITSLTVALFTVGIFAPVTASAAGPIGNSTKSAACEGIGAAGANCGGTSGGGVSSLVGSAINILSWIVGVAAVIMVIVGGFQYVTSGGDSTKVGNAKNTILYAIIGLVIAVLAQGIVRYVLKEVT